MRSGASVSVEFFGQRVVGESVMSQDIGANRKRPFTAQAGGGSGPSGSSRPPHSQALSRSTYDAAMSTQRAIDALSDPTIAVDDALRHALIVGTRIQSTSIKEWVDAELFGYPDESEVPAYRRLDQEMLRVDMYFSGYGGREFTHSLGFNDLPSELQIYEGGLMLRQPANSLAKLAASDSETKAAMQVPTKWCGMYNYLSDEGKIALQTPLSRAVAARIIMDKGMLDDVVSAVRTSALKLLLELEQVGPQVGEPGGPTVNDDERLRGIDLRIGELHGPLIVTAGHGNTISAQSSEGDLTVIYEKASEFIEPDGIEQLKAALFSDGGRPGKETNKFLERVKSGAVNLVGGVTASAAYEGLSALVQTLM